jgi:hypothetical protein
MVANASRVTWYVSGSPHSHATNSLAVHVVFEVACGHDVRVQVRELRQPLSTALAEHVPVA